MNFVDYKDGDLANQTACDRITNFVFSRSLFRANEEEEENEEENIHYELNEEVQVSINDAVALFLADETEMQQRSQALIAIASILNECKFYAPVELISAEALRILYFMAIEGDKSLLAPTLLIFQVIADLSAPYYKEIYDVRIPAFLSSLLSKGIPFKNAEMIIIFLATVAKSELDPEYFSTIFSSGCVTDILTILNFFVSSIMPGRSSELPTLEEMPFINEGIELNDESTIIRHLLLFIYNILNHDGIEVQNSIPEMFDYLIYYSFQFQGNNENQIFAFKHFIKCITKEKYMRIIWEEFSTMSLKGQLLRLIQADEFSEEEEECDEEMKIYKKKLCKYSLSFLQNVIYYDCDHDFIKNPVLIGTLVKILDCNDEDILLIACDCLLNMSSLQYVCNFVVDSENIIEKLAHNVENARYEIRISICVTFQQLLQSGKHCFEQIFSRVKIIPIIAPLLLSDDQRLICSVLDIFSLFVIYCRSNDDLLKYLISEFDEADLSSTLQILQNGSSLYYANVITLYQDINEICQYLSDLV